MKIPTIDNFDAGRVQVRLMRSTSRYVKQIENLQLQVEELMHEKDNIALQWANAQKVTKRYGREPLAVILPSTYPPG